MICYTRKLCQCNCTMRPLSVSSCLITRQSCLFCRIHLSGLSLLQPSKNKTKPTWPRTHSLTRISTILPAMIYWPTLWLDGQSTIQPMTGYSWIWPHSSWLLLLICQLFLIMTLTYSTLSVPNPSYLYLNITNSHWSTTMPMEAGIPWRGIPRRAIGRDLRESHYHWVD